MSVTTEAYKDKYAGLGTTGPYPITFEVNLDDGGNAEDIKVLLLDDTGVETDITSACTISGLNVYTDVAYDSTYYVILVRWPLATQPYTFPYKTKFPSKSFEDALDRLAFIIQRMALESDQSLKAAVSDDAIDRLPAAVERANTFLAFDSDGNPIAASGVSSVPISTWAETLLDDESAAAARTTLGLSALGSSVVIAETIEALQDVISPTTELTDDTEVSNPGKYIVNAPGGIITLPGSSTEGVIFDFIFKSSARIVQNHASAGISYKGVFFTTKGVYVDTVGAETGYIQAKPGDRIILAYSGTGENRIEPAVALSSPGTLPASTGRGVSFSRDGNYLAIAHYNSPYITIYKRSGDVFTKLSDPATLPTANAYSVAFSPDSNYLAVGHTTSPYITIYKRSGDVFTKLSDPATLPTAGAYGVAFSPDGIYLAVAHYNTSPYITIYKRSGDTFTKLSDPATLPDGACWGCAFSPDGDYLAVGHDGSTYYFTIYKRSGDTFTKISNPASMPPASVYGLAFSPDGNYLALGHNTSPYITIYKRSGDTFTKLSDPATLPAAAGRGVSFSPDGNYLAIPHNNSPYVTIYKRSGDTFSKLSDPATLPGGYGYGASFSPDGVYLAIAHGDYSPFLRIYKTTEALTNAWLALSVETKFEGDKQYMFK